LGFGIEAGESLGAPLQGCARVLGLVELG
jgi:hypothetical protein